MSVREIFNLRSRPSMFVWGALALTAAYLDFSQATAASGTGKAVLLGLGMACLMGGAGLVIASVSGLRESWRKAATRPEGLQPAVKGQIWQAPVSNTDPVRQLHTSRNDRALDAAGALLIGSGISWLEPTVAPFVGGITLTFAAVKAGLAAHDHYQLHRLRRTPDNTPT